MTLPMEAFAELVILFPKNSESLDRKSSWLNQQDTARGVGGEGGIPIIQIILSNFSI